MLSAKRVIYLAAGVALVISQNALAAQATEEDSAYQWGRWAVLSPAAGGAEPYAGADAPGAEYNARPGDADQFQPEIASFELPGEPPVPQLPPEVVPNPPGEPPPIGGGRPRPPVATTNPPDSQPPIGGGRPR